MSLTTRDSVSLSSAAVGIATVTVQKVRTNQPANYTIDGVGFFKAATDDLWTLSGNALAANQVCVFYLLLDSAGAASVQQSAIKTASTAASGYVPGAFEWPQVANKCVVGAVMVKSGGAAFTPGTTSLAGLGTYFNAVGDYGKPMTF